MDKSNTEDSAYSKYWARKKMLAQNVPAFPAKRWWATDGLCEIEQIFFDQIRSAESLLDVGAGDLRVMRKLQAAGFDKEYHTLDIGQEFDHTYASLDEVERTYDAIICLDVIEHLTLTDGLHMLSQMASKLAPGGTLIVQTPNARCVRNPWGTDMTHLHCYNITDLWAYLTCHDLNVSGYRVVFTTERRSFFQKIHDKASAYVASRLLGCDYADNIALLATRPK
ncbi:class I SAM-dependent methyltransferase [Blastopirellula retiformator]|uniref:Bifunctional 3-demethylubiquinone-9 3-methyltransferase/ 2-octaprenyl-6-hydroxy phenol methylase n=1 Tax=Blastopirellula retiformator TaxID=2527970 RepID=A0A5C5V4W1_9BACT|nr:class I SAM-dependent methyltransferase [Blastopirellula retiformator]TWT33009.1 bifunctional 3-demethylubiquinone-9 3-methyltransferase/ 2-octaprenyl-6-hydroxy phenol methylase [Blastopirellula retiformator]